MASSIDQANLKAKVHEAYKRQGSKLRNTLQTISNVNRSAAVFQKVGKGTAMQNPRIGWFR